MFWNDSTECFKPSQLPPPEIADAQSYAGIVTSNPELRPIVQTIELLLQRIPLEPAVGAKMALNRELKTALQELKKLRKIENGKDSIVESNILREGKAGGKAHRQQRQDKAQIIVDTAESALNSSDTGVRAPLTRATKPLGNKVHV